MVDNINKNKDMEVSNMKLIIIGVQIRVILDIW